MLLIQGQDNRKDLLCSNDGCCEPLKALSSRHAQSCKEILIRHNGDAKMIEWVRVAFGVLLLVLECVDVSYSSLQGDCIISDKIYRVSTAILSMLL